MSANKNPSHPCHYLHPLEVKGFRGYNHIIRFIVTAIHELLGHGTGKLLTETTPGTYNFDREDLPTNPLRGKAIETWYQPGQTWTSVFEKLASRWKSAGRCWSRTISQTTRRCSPCSAIMTRAQSRQMIVSTPGPNSLFSCIAHTEQSSTAPISMSE